MNSNFLKANEAIEAKEATSTRGFTLIELLVVIAIIGILSGIVLTSLGTARTKAKDASASASMSSMRSQAELGADSNGNYVIDVCGSTANGGLDSLIDAVNAQTSTYDVSCGGTGATNLVVNPAWGAAVELNNGTVYCVDSTGFSGVTTVAATAGDDGAVEIDPDYASTDVLCNNT